MADSPSPSCPSRERLEAVARDPTCDAEADSHASSCARCRELTDQIRRNNALLDRFVNSARDPQVPGWTMPPSGIIPGHDLLAEVHRGGQGVVYEALQRSTGRRVAVKVVREGPFAGRGDRLRFAREVTVLARLNHPNIVAIHDSGTAAGMDYYVMDYIQGRPLDEYTQKVEKSKSRKVEIAALLSLFVKVCEAVNAAHLRGIIHRDLKPGNVLVDADGEPHVLDFGLARLTDDDLLQNPDCKIQSLTMTGQFVGSLPWAAPEQAAGQAAEIDVRSDVYALGVMLYQALCGRFPYEVGGELSDVLNNIRHAEPAPMRGRGAGLTPVLSRTRGRGGRGQEPSPMRGEGACGVSPPTARVGLIAKAPDPLPIDDEVETIVLKCLRKERDQRYQTAGELARDLRHYLAGEPIEAKRESTLYVVRKQLRRYRGALAAAALVMIAVAGFAMYAVVQAERQGRLAMLEREARESAEKAREQAASAAARAGAVNAFLRDMLSSVNPQNSPNPEVTVREVLDQAARTIESGTLADQPEIAAALRDTLGEAYSALGLYPQAERFLTAALDAQRTLLGEDHPDATATRTHLGVLRYHQGRYDVAEPLFQEALERRRALHGPRHPEVATLLHYLAALYAAQRKPEVAEPLIREALAIQQEHYEGDHPDVAKSLDGLAVIVNRQGRAAEAEPLYRESLAMHQRVYGEENPEYAAALNNMAHFLQSRGELEAAETPFRQALTINRKVLGNSHPGLAPYLNNLGALLRDLRRLSDAEPLAREGLEIRRQTLPAGHPDIGRSTLLLGLIHLERDRPGEAEPLLRECWEIRKQSQPDGHYLTSEAASVLGECLTRLERYDEAEPLLVNSYPIIKAGRGEDHERTLEALRRLIRHYDSRGLPGRAAEYRRMLSDEGEP